MPLLACMPPVLAACVRRPCTAQWKSIPLRAILPNMLTDKVYADIRDRILNLSLKPGTPLSFAALSAQYHVSISPIRDALKRLASEGLVEIKPQSGTSVSLIDLDKVRDERFIRLYLELGAIEKLDKAKWPLIAIQWEELLSRQHEAFSCRDTTGFLMLDDSMHKMLFDATGHSKVFESIRSSSGNYHRIRMVSYLFDDILQNTLMQHSQLLEALKSGDVQRLLELDRRHISKIEVETADYQKAYPQYFRQ